MSDLYTQELTRLECGERVARNVTAARIATLAGRTPGGAWSHACLMFAQVANGLAPYGRKTPGGWMPGPLSGGKNE